MAEDVTLRRGLLAPRARQFVWSSTRSDPSVDTGGFTPSGIYRFRRLSTLYGDTDYWLYWSESDVDVVPGPVANLSDSDQRHYYTGAGDGRAKIFTADSLIEVPSVHGETADSKYPYVWFYLGVSAPATAPVIDTSAVVLPTDAVISGRITRVVSDTLSLYGENGRARHGHNSDVANWQKNGACIYRLTTTSQPIGGDGEEGYGFIPGARFRIASIVDANTVTLSGLAGATQALAVQLLDNDWYFGSTPNDGNDSMYSRCTYIYPGVTKWQRCRFDLPSGAILTSAGHVFAVDDVVRITAVNQSMLYHSQSEFLLSAPDGTVRRVATSINPHSVHANDSEQIVFEGDLSYIIERNGADFDPTITGTGAVVNVETISRVYVYTYVTHLGEESAPSPPSAVVTLQANDAIGVGSFAVPADDHQRITHIRIYRAATGTDSTEFLLVDEISVAQTSYTDNKDDSELSEALPSETWDVPDTAMRGLVAHPSGAIAGFYKNVVTISEPGQCHAFPEEYKHYLDYQVIGLSVLGSSIVVLTDGAPYVISGAHPRQMTARKTTIRQPCLDKRSIVNTGDQIIYASPNGLVRITPDGAETVTAEHYTKEDWATVVGSHMASSRTLRAWFYDDQYILDAVYTLNSTTTETKLVFDFKSDKMQLTTFTDDIVAGFYDSGYGEFFYVTNTSAHETPTIIGSLPGANYMPLLRWGYLHPNTDPASDYAQGTWYSKTFEFPDPIAPAAARVVCRRKRQNGTINVKAYVNVVIFGVRYGVWNTAHDLLVDETTVVSSATLINGTPTDASFTEHRSDPFRISGNGVYDAVRFELRIYGPVEVEAVHIAESMDELGAE